MKKINSGGFHLIYNASQLPNTLKSLQHFMEEYFLLSILNKVLNS